MQSSYLEYHYPRQLYGASHSNVLFMVVAQLNVEMGISLPFLPLTQKSRGMIQHQKHDATSVKLGKKEERISQHLPHCFLREYTNNKLIEIVKPLIRVSQILPLWDDGRTEQWGKVSKE